LDADCTSGQIARLTASKRRNASLSLHQATHRPSSAAALSPAGAGDTSM